MPSFSFLASRHLLIGSLHITCILILIITTSIWKNLLLVVILRISQIQSQLFLSLSLPFPIPTFISCTLNVLLTVIEVIFEFFVKQHLIRIANCWIFVRRSLWSSLSRRILWSWIDDSGGGSVRVGVERRFIFSDFLVWLFQFLKVIRLDRYTFTLMRSINCLLSSISSRVYESRCPFLICDFFMWIVRI